MRTTAIGLAALAGCGGDGPSAVQVIDGEWGMSTACRERASRETGMDSDAITAAYDDTDLLDNTDFVVTAGERRFTCGVTEDLIITTFEDA